MTPVELALSLLLAQTCVAEIGFQKSPRECVLMWQTNQVQAAQRGRTLYLQARLYNNYWIGRHSRARRPWIRELTYSGQKPRQWPAGASWVKYRPRWLKYVSAADGFVKGRYKKRYCPAASHYGAPHERRNKKMKRVMCFGGNTKQWYWRVER